MTKTDLKELYQVACDGKGRKADDGQLRVWVLTLLHLDKADLSQALVWYFTENSDFPMPAQLKPLAERARRNRFTAGNQKGRVAWMCPTCKTRTVGFLAPGAETLRTCHSSYGPCDPVRKIYSPSLPCDANGQAQLCGAILDVESDVRPVCA
jgi:hypothetical protein